MDPTGPVRAVILDLDGTLIDTAGEIVEAMDRTLDELALPRVPAREIEAMIGRGVRKLVERVLERLDALDALEPIHPTITINAAWRRIAFRPAYPAIRVVVQA